MWNDVLFLAAAFSMIGLLLWVANVAEKRRQQGEPYQGLALVPYLTLIVIYAFALLAGVVVPVVARIAATQPQMLQEMGMENNVQFSHVNSIGLVSLGLWLPALMGILLLLPPVRRIVARLIPIDPGSPVHAVALSLTSLVATNLLITLGIGLNNLASALEQQNAVTPSSDGATLISLWAQQIFMAILAMVGVGWLSRRDWPTSLQRLGLVVPSWRQVAVGVGLALLLVPLVLLVEYLGGRFGIGENADVEKLSEQLLGPLFHSPIGIITVGAAAAIGEETLFRGALLPRFGLLFTSIIFALLHSNYGISISTLIVFVLGLILGVVRMRANTTTSMIVHGLYNSTLGLLVFLGM